jgi:tetratricopeptide (TPR) repeat protein
MNQTTPGSGTTQAPSAAEGQDSHIGRYQIVGTLGEGGFGTVYEAEQSHPVKRRVALKVIKLGMDTREVIARFEAERQALALMDHPHIARVLDAGATEAGRPYFVMELVKGEPISGYCDRMRLGIRQRLDLFGQVCAAVQHAHAKGVIHRDLKPSNVLVSTHDDRPFAKVIDFGIAKATGRRLTDLTLFTAQAQMMGTPLYMSPEQAEGSADIDTRTDIYSLGVMLYELLTGSTPVPSDSLRVAAYAEIQRVIREVDPPLPSSRLRQSQDTGAEVASRRGTEPRTLTRQVRGELDWIVMKALDKDRARRYETANGLAMDIRRFLDGEPVLAAPPGAGYRARKFVRRHKGAVAAAALVAASLLAGIGSFAWQARIARERAAQLELVSKFQAEMLSQVDPTRAGELLGEDVIARHAAGLEAAEVPAADRAAEVQAFATQWARVNATDAASELIDRTILKPAVAAIDAQFAEQPTVAAALRQVLADRYLGMGRYPAARPLQEQALAARRDHLGADHPDTLVSQIGLGGLLLQMGELDAAQPLLLDALQRQRRVRGNDDPMTLNGLNSLGIIAYMRGDLALAETYLSEALATLRRVHGNEHPYTMASISNLGSLLQGLGRPAEAEALFREAAALQRKVLGADDPGTLTSINNLALALQAQGKSAEAEPYLREVLAAERRINGEEHPDTLTSINTLGFVLQAQSKLVEAERLYLEALEKQRRVRGDGDVNTLTTINNLGSLWVAQGRYAEAMTLLEPAEAAMRAAPGGPNAERQVAKLLLGLGKARQGTGDYEAAEAALLEAHALYVKVRGAGHAETRDCAQALADHYAARHERAPAMGYDGKAAQWLGQAAAPAVP